MKSKWEDKNFVKAYMKAYRNKLENKLKRKLYNEAHKEEILKKAKINRNKPKNKLKRKLYLEAYNQRPEVIARRNELNNRLESKARKREYDKIHNHLPHIKKRHKKNRRQWYLKNKEKILKQIKEYKKINKEKIKQHNKEYSQREEVKKRDNENRKIRKIMDIQFNLQCNFRSRLWAVLKKYTKNGKIMSSKKYGINYKKIIEHLKPFPKDIENYEVDHIIPLSKFDLTNPEQVKKAFAPENHAWLTKWANRSKGDKLVHPDYYIKYGYEYESTKNN